MSHQTKLHAAAYQPKM